MFKKWKTFGDFFIVLIVFLSYHQMVHTLDTYGKQGPSGSQRPIGNSPPPKSPGGNTAGEIVVEIQTPPSNINSVVNAKPSDNNRPISPTPKPGTSKPGSKPGSKPSTQPTKPGIPPVINVMAIKTGFLSAANDPCSYVSCIRADSYLHCAVVKCDPGQAFSQASSRCLPSNQCPAKSPVKLPGNVQSKPNVQQLPQKSPQTQSKTQNAPHGQSRPW